MSSTEGIEEDSLVLLHYLFSCNDTSHWETVTHTFGHGNDIRFKASPSVAPEFLAYSSETCLDFIGNDDASIFFDE